MKVKYTLRELTRRIYNRLNNSNNGDPNKNGEYRILEKVLSSTSGLPVLFDVGGAYGEWSYKALEIIPGSTVYIFEPLPLMQQHIKKRFSDNPHVILIEGAVGERDGQVEIFTDLESIYPRLSVKRPGKESVSVQCYGLDGFLKGNSVNSVRYMKMDIEGHEAIALRGAREALANGRFDYIQFEYGGCNIDSQTYLKDFFDCFQGMPYRIARIHPHHLEYIQEYDPKHEDFQYSNWIAEKIGIT